MLLSVGANPVSDKEFAQRSSLVKEAASEGMDRYAVQWADLMMKSREHDAGVRRCIESMVREQADTNERDDVHLLDFRAGVQLPDDWRVTAWGKNALDEEYHIEYSTGGFVYKATPARFGLDFMKRF